jgi:uncharacterized protein YeeX (DUF496 family)
MTKIYGSSIEQMFLKDYIKVLDHLEKQQVDYIIAGVQEDYPERVGYIRATKDLRSELDRLLKAYFPNE